MKKAIVVLIVMCFVFSIMSVLTLAEEVGDAGGTGAGGGSTSTIAEKEEELNEKIAEYNGKVKDLEDLENKQDEYLAKKEALDGILKDGYYDLVKEYNDLAGDYKELYSNYQNNKAGVSYENVSDAYDAAIKAYDKIYGDDNDYKAAVQAAEKEASEAYAAYKAAYDEYLLKKAEIEELADEIHDLVDSLNAEAKKAYDDAMEIYNDWFAKKEAYLEWEAEYEVSQPDVVFKSGSKLISDTRATIESFEPGKSSENGNKGKVNPTDEDVLIATGLKLIAYEGSKQWAFLVEAEAVGVEFLFWAHGNVAGEFLRITFNEEGIYLIGTSNGMNHLYVVEPLEEEPEDPDEMEEPVQKTYNFTAKSFEPLDGYVGSVLIGIDPPQEKKTNTTTGTTKPKVTPTPTPTPSPTPIEVKEEDPPTGDAPKEDVTKEPAPEIEIVEENVPQSKMPQTGIVDTKQIWLYGLFVSLLGLGTLLLITAQTDKKKNKN